MPIGDQDMPWAPHIICGSCQSTLEAMAFAIPRIYRENQLTTTMVVTST